MGISTEGKIGIGLTLLFGAGAGAVMVAPEQQVWIGWILIIVSAIGFVLLISYHLATRVRKPREERVNLLVSDIGFNGALIAAAVSAIATILRSPRVAIIAAVLAWGGIGLDYWFGPPRAFIFSKDSWLAQEFGQPITWFPFAQAVDPGNKQSRYFLLEMVGRNVTEQEVILSDAYFISGVTGAQVHPKVEMVGKNAAIADINPIPPGAFFSLIVELSPPNGITADDFLKVWGPFSFVAAYGNGKTQRIEFSRERAVQLLTQPRDIAPFPHVTLKHPTGGVGN
jgi:hypothetical protein